LEFNYDSPENRAILKSIIYEDGPVAVALNVTQDFIDYWGIRHNSDDYYPDTDEPWGNSLNHILEYGGLFIAMYYATVNYDAESIDWPPVANAGGLYQVESDDLITFDGSKSIDAEGEIFSYEWDFGDEEGNIGVDSTLVGVGQDPIIIDASGLFGIEVTVENPSDDLVLTNLEWNADVSELIVYGNSHGIIPMLSNDEAFSKLIYVVGLGIGSISINVENIEKTEKFIVLGPLVLGLNLQ